MSTPLANRRAIAALVVGMAAYSANDAMVKLLGQTYPIGQVIFMRGIVTIFVAVVLVYAFGQGPSIRLTFNRFVLLRAGMEAVISLMFTTTLTHMPIGELSAVVLAAPLFITAIAVIFRMEVVGWRRWASIVVGFIGTLIMIRPTPGAIDSWALVGLLCALLSAVRDVLTRRIDAAVPSVVAGVGTAVTVAFAGLALATVEEWKAVDPSHLGIVALAGLFLSTGIALVVMAFRKADMATLAPFRYTLLIWATTYGFFIFGERPDRWALIGGILIVASGLYAHHRDRIRARKPVDPLSRDV